jgi:high-affinity iron transporter
VHDRIEAAIRLVVEPTAPLALFVGSSLIIFREGFEALLILGALAAYLRKSAREGRVRDLYLGAAAAIVASLALWVAAKTVIRLSGAGAEILEGATMLLAAGVLFYVSHWLISKAQHAKWDAFVRRRMDGALESGGRAAFLGVSFLVVFREGFETVLFYEALSTSAADAIGVSSLLGGFLAGSVALVGVYAAIAWLGMRVPIGRFFAATGALLYLMAFKFSGDGVRELQEGGLVDETLVSWVPHSPALSGWLGIHPFAETLALQGVLVLAIAVGLVLTFRARGAPAAHGASRSAA